MAKTNTKTKTRVLVAQAPDKVNALFALDTPSAAPTPDAGESISGDIVKWGKDNDFPMKLYDLYDHCSTFQSIVEGTADYISGNGLANIHHAIDDFAGCVNDDGDDLFDIVDRIGWNSEFIGGVFLLITRTLDKKHISGLLVLDARRCRCKADNTGVKYFNMKDGKLQNTFVEYKYWSGLDADTAEAEIQEVYYWRGRRPRGYYPRARYLSALMSIDTQIEIQRYYSSLVQNNFTICGILTIPADGMTEDQQKEFYKRVNATYSGSAKAGRLLAQFVSDMNLAAQYTPISANDLDKQYIEVSKSTRENIYAAFRAIPALFGIMTETTGFSQQEFLDAFMLYSATVVAPRQRDIIRIFSDIFGIESPFTIVPFNFNSQTNAKPDTTV